MCKWDAAAKELPTEFLDSRNGLLGAQRLLPRKGHDACHADMLSSFDLDTAQGQRDAAELRSSSGGPAGAFLTAILGGRMTLGDDESRYVWLAPPGAPRSRSTCSPPQCKCSAGVAAEADHAMVCEKVARMTHVRHDNLANALRLVVSACRCQSAEPRYRALAGKKGIVECQRRGDIVAVLLRLELAAVDVVVAHASAESYAAQPAKAAG